MGNGGYRVWMTSRTGSAWRIWGIWRKLAEMRPDLREAGWLSLVRRDLCGGCHTCWGDRVRLKSQDKKTVPLSPNVEKPLNSKVIKSFLPEKKESKVFFVFRDSDVLTLWTFDVRFTHSHIMAMVQRESERKKEREREKDWEWYRQSVQWKLTD